jgi:hypothetical protein
LAGPLLLLLLLLRDSDDFDQRLFPELLLPGEGLRSFNLTIVLLTRFPVCVCGGCTGFSEEEEEEEALARFPLLMLGIGVGIFDVGVVGKVEPEELMLVDGVEGVVGVKGGGGV